MKNDTEYKINLREILLAILIFLLFAWIFLETREKNKLNDEINKLRKQNLELIINRSEQ